MPLTNQMTTLPETELYTPVTSTFGVPASMSLSTVPGHRAQSQSQDVMAFQATPALRKASNRPGSSNGSSRSFFPDDEITSPSSAVFPHDLGFSRRGGAVWKISHGPPNNTVHGPPNLNLYSPVSGTSPKSAGGIPPVRPPRPPPLNLYPTTTKRPLNTGTSPSFVANRTITFALPPNPRSHSSAELSSTIPHSVGDPPASSEDQADIDSRQENPGNLRGAANLPLSPTSNPSSPAASRKTRRVLDHSDSLVQKRVYQTNFHTSSTPHLPHRDKSEVSPLIPPDRSAVQWDDAPNFPLSLFPQPPSSLAFKRRNPKNLVLRVAPSGAPLPPPPMPSPLEFTPTVTPTVSRPGTPRSLPRSRPMPPPFYDPPLTPLPTPPASPLAPKAVPPPSPPRSLRSIKSANHLRSELCAPPTLAPAHRVTSSEPRNLSEDSRNVDGTRFRMQPFSEVLHEIQPFVSNAKEGTVRELINDTQLVG